MGRGDGGRWERQGGEGMVGGGRGRGEREEGEGRERGEGRGITNTLA